MVFAAARMLKIFLAFLRDFFQRFQAVGDKAGADYVHAFGLLFAQLLERDCRVRLEPFGFAETRLEAEKILLRLQAQFLRQQTSGLVAFAVIGVAFVQ